MSAKRYFDRVGYVEIEQPDGSIVKIGGDGIECLDMKFEVTKISGIYSTFSVSILGLSGDTINRLTFFNPADSYENRYVVNVYAGYREMRGPEKIARGYVFMSKPTNPPERWLQMKCILFSELKKTIDKPYSLKNKTVYSIFEEIARLIDAEHSWLSSKLDKNKKVKTFEFKGSLDSVCSNFASRFDCICQLTDDKVLVCRDKATFYENPKDVKELNVYTGFIDTVGIDIGGATFKTRLNTRYETGDWLHFESAVNPKYNGYYYIVQTKLVGHLRGEEWFCELKTLRWCNKKGGK